MTQKERHNAQLKSIGKEEHEFFICKHCGAHVYADKCTCDPEKIAAYKQKRAINCGKK